MAYDERLATRVRDLLAGERRLTEKRMFGGLAFMVDGHMACGVLADRLMLRLGPEGAAEALREKHTRPMDFTGRPMASMLYVDAAGCRRDADLRAWVTRAVRFARTLPPTSGRRARRTPSRPATR